MSSVVILFGWFEAECSTMSVKRLPTISPVLTSYQLNDRLQLRGSYANVERCRSGSTFQVTLRWIYASSIACIIPAPREVKVIAADNEDGKLIDPPSVLPIANFISKTSRSRFVAIRFCSDSALSPAKVMYARVHCPRNTPALRNFSVWAALVANSICDGFEPRLRFWSLALESIIFTV